METFYELLFKGFRILDVYVVQWMSMQLLSCGVVPHTVQADTSKATVRLQFCNSCFGFIRKDYQAFR